jgi:hypothetical protein
MAIVPPTTPAVERPHPRFAVIRLQWTSAEALSTTLDSMIQALALRYHTEVRIVGQSHDRTEILYTVQIGRYDAPTNPGQ